MGQLQTGLDKPAAFIKNAVTTDFIHVVLARSTNDQVQSVSNSEEYFTKLFQFRSEYLNDNLASQKARKRCDQTPERAHPAVRVVLCVKLMASNVDVGDEGLAESATKQVRSDGWPTMVSHRMLSFNEARACIDDLYLNSLLLFFCGCPISECIP